MRVFSIKHHQYETVDQKIGIVLTVASALKSLQKYETCIVAKRNMETI